LTRNSEENETENSTKKEAVFLNEKRYLVEILGCNTRKVKTSSEMDMKK